MNPLLNKHTEERTDVGYEVDTAKLYVDRRYSGNVDFHPAFAGRHAGSLPQVDGEIQIRLLVDTSSVEVFGNAGYRVITDRIFPTGEPCRRIELFVQEGVATCGQVDVWKLRSALPQADGAP